MSARGGFKRGMFVTAAVTVPVLVIAACTIQLRGDDDRAPAGSSASRTTNPVAAKLERCRKVTSEQVAELEACRLIWAENRGRFLGSKKTSAASSVDARSDSPVPAFVQPKNPGRLPQPPVATPGRE